MNTVWFRLHFFLWTVLVLLLGYVLGTLFLEVEEVGAPSPISIVGENTSQKSVPVIHVRKIASGSIVGTVNGDARLFIAEDLVQTEEDGSFHVPASSFLVNVIDVPVPQGAKFLASKRGKKYYRVDSSGGQKIVPENRVYFQTAEEAEKKGYVP